MGYFDWSKSDVERAIKDALKEGKDSVGLSMDKNSHENELAVVEWAKELGYDATLEMERVTVKLK